MHKKIASRCFVDSVTGFFSVPNRTRQVLAKITDDMVSEKKNNRDSESFKYGIIV